MDPKPGIPQFESRMTHRLF